MGHWFQNQEKQFRYDCVLSKIGSQHENHNHNLRGILAYQLFGFNEYKSTHTFCLTYRDTDIQRGTHTDRYGVLENFHIMATVISWVLQEWS